MTTTNEREILFAWNDIDPTDGGGHTFDCIAHTGAWVGMVRALMECWHWEAYTQDQTCFQIGYSPSLEEAQAELIAAWCGERARFTWEDASGPAPEWRVYILHVDGKEVGLVEECGDVRGEDENGYWTWWPLRDGGSGKTYRTLNRAMHAGEEYARERPSGVVT